MSALAVVMLISSVVFMLGSADRYTDAVTRGDTSDAVMYGSLEVLWIAIGTMAIWIMVST